MKGGARGVGKGILERGSNASQYRNSECTTRPRYVKYEDKPQKMRFENQEPSMPSEGIWTLFSPGNVNTESFEQEASCNPR